MKVKELIKELNKFNGEADIDIIVHCKKEDFSIVWDNGGDSITQDKENVISVGLYVDRLCGNDN